MDDGRLEEDISSWLPPVADEIPLLSLGDLMICLEVVDKQAGGFENTLEEELFSLWFTALTSTRLRSRICADEQKMKYLQRKSLAAILQCALFLAAMPF